MFQYVGLDAQTIIVGIVTFLGKNFSKCCKKLTKEDSTFFVSVFVQTLTFINKHNGLVLQKQGVTILYIYKPNLSPNN